MALERVKQHGHRAVGLALVAKGALAFSGATADAPPPGVLTFDNLEARIEAAAQGHSGTATRDQAASDVLVGGALAALRRERERQF